MSAEHPRNNWLSSLRQDPAWMWTFALIAVSAGLRLAVAWGLPAYQVPSMGTYPYALHDHLWTYVWQATLLPPVNYVIQALPILLLGPAGNALHHGHLYVNFAMDLTAVWLLFRASRIVDVPVAVGWSLSLALSVALVPFELWRANVTGDHYDHATPMLASLLVFACIYTARHGVGRKSIVLSAGAGVLLILQLPTAAYIIPALFVLILFTELLTGRLGARAGAKAAALLLPALLAVSILGAKNGLVAGVPTPGAKGGAALMMFVQEALNADGAAVRQLAVESGAPGWYLWCYDHPTLPPGVTAGGLWDRLAPAFGICMPWTEAPGLPGKAWPFEFDGLISQLQAGGHADLAARVIEDQKDAVSRQYLFMGHSPELSARWIAIYGQQSQRVGFHLLLTRPGLYLDTLRRHHRDAFWGNGPEFLASTASNLKTQDYFLRPALSRFARFWFPAVPRAAYPLLPIAVLLALAVVIIDSRKGWDSTRSMEALRLYLWLGLPVLMSALFYSGAVAVENDRYFVHVLPYLVAVLGIMCSHVTMLTVRHA